MPKQPERELRPKRRKIVPKKHPVWSLTVLVRAEGDKVAKLFVDSGDKAPPPSLVERRVVNRLLNHANIVWSRLQSDDACLSGDFKFHVIPIQPRRPLSTGRVHEHEFSQDIRIRQAIEQVMVDASARETFSMPQNKRKIFRNDTNYFSITFERVKIIDRMTDRETRAKHAEGETVESERFDDLNSPRQWAEVAGPENGRNDKLSPEFIEARISQAEQRSAEFRRLQIDELQSLLKDLAGTSKGTFEGNKADASRVMKLVEAAEAALLYTGPGKKGKNYDNYPCTINCEHEEVSSFQLRTSGKPVGYVGSVDAWPEFTVVAREDVPKLSIA